MRLTELFHIAEDVKQDILTILGNTDSQKLINFATQTLAKVDDKEIDQMQAQKKVAEQVSTQELQIIADKLSKVKDEQMLNKLYGVLYNADIENRVDKLWDARGFNNKRMAKYKPIFREVVINSSSPIKSKIQFLFMLTKNIASIPGESFTKSFTGSWNDIVPDKMKSNPTYTDTISTFIGSDSFRGKGIGPAEFALALFGKNSNIVDHQGDVKVDGWGVELKDGRGGSIKPGTAQGHRAADSARDKLGQALGLEFKSGRGKAFNDTKFQFHYENNVVRALQKLPDAKQYKLLKAWADELYPAISDEGRDQLVKGIIAHKGTEEVKSHFGKMMLDKYKENDEWDSIVFINPLTMAMANITDSSNADMIDYKLAGLNRGGDTQALPDGYINGVLRKS